MRQEKCNRIGRLSGTAVLPVVLVLTLAGCAAGLEFVDSNGQNVLSSGYSNSGSAGSGAGNGLPSGPLTADDVQRACASGLDRQAIYPVAFPRPTHRCQWNQNGNLGMRDSYFQARTEQVANVTLPANALICDMQFQFANQNFYYDDHFMMTFNGVILAASYDFSSLMPSTNNLLQYDWTAMVGRSWLTSNERTFCTGADRGLANCTFPVTSTQGRISLNYDMALIHEISAQSHVRPTHEFRWITTGDNDDAVDCLHEPVDFDVIVTYVEL